MLVTRPSRLHRPPEAVDLSVHLGVAEAEPIRARVLDIPRGAASGERLARLTHPSVVVEGVVLRLVRLGRRTTASLNGPGDVLPRAQEEPPPFAVDNRALTPVRIAPLDDAVMAAIASAPAVACALAARVSRHHDELVLQSILIQLVSIEERLAILLPHLADRWGTVSADGVLLPGFLSHTVLAALVGVRRPSLTTAIAGLATAEMLTRLPDRRWLVAPDLAGLATSGTP